MKQFIIRRLTQLTLFMLVMIISTYFIYAPSPGLDDNISFVTGWILVAVMVALMLFNLRKKLPFIALLRASTWLQFHLYAGFFCIYAFMTHIQFRIPSGVFESILAVIFCIVVLSGVVGILLSRVMAPKLRASQQEILFERIPSLIVNAKNNVEGLVLNAVEESGSQVLNLFYNHHLRVYFSHPTPILTQMFCIDSCPQKLLHALDELSYSVSANEQEMVAQIADWIKVKQDLDWHYMRQGILKYWLFIHIPFTYALLPVVILHIVVVHAFTGVV